MNLFDTFHSEISAIESAKATHERISAQMREAAKLNRSMTFAAWEAMEKAERAAWAAYKAIEAANK